jgi:hypothetical protein
MLKELENHDSAFLISVSLAFSIARDLTITDLMINDNLELLRKPNNERRLLLHAMNMALSCYQNNSAIDIGFIMKTLNTPPAIRNISRFLKLIKPVVDLYTKSPIWKTDVAIFITACAELLKCRVPSVSTSI